MCCQDGGEIGETEVCCARRDTEGRKGIDPTVDDDAHPDAWMGELSDDARLLWSDGEARASALGDIARAWRQGDPELDSLINRVDSAVVEGLAALGFPRGPVRRIDFRDAGSLLLGQKQFDCTLVLYGHSLESVMAQAASDRIVSTWVHESIHARQPHAPGASIEYRQFQGFEEGLVEGITRYVLEQANIPPAQETFDYYVATYERLASLLGVQTIDLWQRLWHIRRGRSAIFSLMS